MNSTQVILVSGTLIIIVGSINAALNNKPETPVFAGGVGILVLASLLDAIGPGPGKLAAALVALSAVTVLFVEGTAIFQAIQNSQKK